MLKKAFILVLAGIMIFSSFAVLASVLPASAHLYNTNPAITSTGYYKGSVTVLPNGTVTGTGSSQYPLTPVSSNVFSLTENVNGTITDQMNGSTIDGNGLTVNGGSYVAVKAGNVTGITIENLAIINITQATDGIQLYHVFNSVVDNVTINNTNAVPLTMVWVYYSGNVTIENSNFLLGSTSSTYTGSNGIDAEYDSAVNVSFNNFSGTGNPQVWFYFVACYAVGQFNAWGNIVNSSSSSSGDAFSFYGGNAVFASNYVNDTDDAIYVDEAQSITSMNNYISNSIIGFDIEYASSYTSYNDTAVFCSEPLYLGYLGNATVHYGNFRNSTSYSDIEYCNYVTIANSIFSSTSTEYAIYSEYGATLNLYNDQVIAGNSSSVKAVCTDYMAGWVNLANDYIYAPNGYGLYLDSYSPQFNVTNSHLNASNGVYFDYYGNIIGSTISGNTFVGQNMQSAAYLYTEYDAYNINFSNNTVQSPNSSWGEYGFYLEADYMSSNITVYNNTITNNNYSIELDADYGSDAMVQNNTIINSNESIEVEYYYNPVITGNKIINASYWGIYDYADDFAGVDVSYNLIENSAGVGMTYGIYLDDIYGGNNIVSHNSVLNPGSSAYGIYLDQCYPVLVYSNTVNGGEYAYYLEYNGPISLFGNTASNADTGIYSNENSNFSYYSNTVNNANCSFYSYEDYGGYVFANTFSDSQANSSSLYFLQVEYYKGITFYHNNFINSTTNSTVSNYFSGAYGPVFMNAPLPTGGNYWSNYTGTGTNGIGNTPMNVTGTIQDLYPLTSKWTSPTVTFIETGLASGTAWSASMGGSQRSSTGTSIVFSQNNGQYINVGYAIGSVAGYTTSLSSGSVYLNGASITVMVTFTPVPATQYNVTFTESGLPWGTSWSTSWSVTLNGKTETASAPGSITFYEANGTYSYSIAPVDGYKLAESTGSVTVNGNQKTISLNFIPSTNAITYTLKVIETGLPAGDFWNLTLNGGNYTTNSTIISMQVSAGNYSYNVSGPVGYSVSPQSSNFTVNGSNITLYVHFTAQKATPSVTGGTVKVIEGVGLGVLITAIIGIMGSFLATGKFPWDLIRKK